LRTRSLRHSFQDANYHDQIVKERNKPSERVNTQSERLVFCHGQRFIPDARGMTLPQPTETGLNPRQRLPRAAWREPNPSKMGSAARLMKN